MTFTNQEFLKKQNEVFQTNYLATIAFDHDDVMNNFGHGFIQLVNKTFNLSLTTDDMLNWDMRSFVGPEIGNKIYDLLKHPGLFRYLEPAPHANEVITRLQKKGFEIIIVSDSPKGNSHCEYTDNNTLVSNPADDKRAWFAEHLPTIPQDNLIFAGQKHRIRMDLLVDDKPETFLKFEAMGLDILLMDKPYNRDFVTNKRVYDLLEVEQKIYEKFL